MLFIFIVSRNVLSFNEWMRFNLILYYLYKGLWEYQWFSSLQNKLELWQTSNATIIKQSNNFSFSLVISELLHSVNIARALITNIEKLKSFLCFAVDVANASGVFVQNEGTKL